MYRKNGSFVYTYKEEIVFNGKKQVHIVLENYQKKQYHWIEQS